MDNVDYWIWEHASKYGMVQVLRNLKSKFMQINLPNSWISALMLNQVMKDWEKPGKIDYRLLMDVREVLLSTYKLHRKEIKRKIKIANYVKLILYCRATILVMGWQEKNTKEHMWKKAVDKFFPNWTNQVWLALLSTYNLKDTLQEEMCQIHSEIRQILLQEDTLQSIWGKFQIEINECFPYLVSFLSQLQPSTLEKIKTQNTNMGPSMDFISDRLKGNVNEAMLLQLLKENNIRKVKAKCQQILKMMKSKNGSRCDEPPRVFETVMFTLPPDLSGHGEPDASRTSYPACTNHYPHIPSNITLLRSGKLEDYSVNKDFPISVGGALFEPYWFCELNGDPQYPIPAEKIKQEESKEKNLPAKQHEVVTLNATYVVPSRTTMNAASTDSPRKAVLNRLSLSRSGSPRTVKPSGVRTVVEDGVMQTFPPNLPVANKDLVAPSCTTGDEHSNTGTNSKVGSVICHYDSDTQTIKVLCVPENKKVVSASSAPSRATVDCAEPIESNAEASTNVSECNRSEQNSGNAKKDARNEKHDSPEALTILEDKANVSTVSTAAASRRKTSRLERKSTEDSSSERFESSEEDASLTRRYGTRSLKTTVNTYPVLSGRKLRSGKALGKTRISNELESTQFSDREKLDSQSKKKTLGKGPTVDTVGNPEEIRRSSTAAEDSDSDFQPVMKKRRGRKIESDSELSHIRKTQSSMTSINTGNSPRRNSITMRSPPPTHASEESEPCSSTAINSPCNTSKTQKSISRSGGQNRATKRKLDLEAESPRSKRQHIPTESVDKSQIVSKAVETLKQNIVCLRNRPETSAHADLLDRCVNRILRSRRKIEGEQQKLLSDGDIIDGVKLSRKARSRVAKK